MSRHWIKTNAVQTVDDYLAAVPEEARAALEKLRKAIKTAAPKATEGISYRIPTFKLDGRPLVGFGAAKSHCTFYLLSTDVMRVYATELEGYAVGKGSIRYPASKPLPASLVSKLVKARIAEIETGAGEKAKPAKTRPRSSAAGRRQ